MAALSATHGEKGHPLVDADETQRRREAKTRRGKGVLTQRSEDAKEKKNGKGGKHAWTRRLVTLFGLK